MSQNIEEIVASDVGKFLYTINPLSKKWKGNFNSNGIFNITWEKNVFLQKKTGLYFIGEKKKLTKIF